MTDTRLQVILITGVAALCVSACRTPEQRIRPPAEDLLTERIADGPDGKKHELVGKASWYGEKFHGRTTASGEAYDMYAFTAAHKTLPFHSIVRVTDPETLKSVVVRITDRGPYSRGRVVDLSYAAASDLGMIRRGVIPVRLEVLQWGTGEYVRD